MSRAGETTAELERLRRELIGLATRAREVDEKIRELVNLQASLKNAITLTLDALDFIEASVRRP